MTGRSLQPTRTGLRPGGRPSGPPPVDTTAALNALEDPDCRAILEVATDEPRTARELRERSGLPRSTIYRKIDQLVDAGLLAEGLRLSTDGAHASEYRRTVEDVVVSISPDGEVDVDVRRTSPGAE